MPVTDGRHRFRLPDEPDFLPREEPRRLVSAPDTDGDGRPEAAVEGYTGGAHCCFVYLVFDSRPGSTNWTASTWETAAWRAQKIWTATAGLGC